MAICHSLLSVTRSSFHFTALRCVAHGANGNPSAIHKALSREAVYVHSQQIVHPWGCACYLQAVRVLLRPRGIFSGRISHRDRPCFIIALQVIKIYQTESEHCARPQMPGLIDLHIQGEAR